MQHRHDHDMASVRCDLYPECQCDGDCQPSAFQPLSGPAIFWLAGIVIACLLIAMGILAHVAARALS
ncbi:MAG TPA: hypothetical protein VGV39_04780 [Mesorhizobium sp.]|jgi:hypothetical protein|uniref:hypothetical protein n=1 Tax=Mesorhizobium sp. TaxID=1871066 RepID=UPI002DDDB53C|nr:hypothetical protein [Mesorhizobium sp.]HEV2502364.1 hypothetical protein [Mesorhizobium sp.]